MYAHRGTKSGGGGIESEHMLDLKYQQYLSNKTDKMPAPLELMLEYEKR